MIDVIHIYVNNIVSDTSPIPWSPDAEARLRNSVIPTPATVHSMTPRYEYRVWAPDLTELEARLAKHCEPLGMRVSEETYLVVLRADLNIKIRSGILDVKQLVRTERSFQLWTPLLKEGFPLPASSARELLAHLTDSDPPAGPGESFTIDGFLALAEEAGAVRASVAKRRHGYLQAGCILEFAEVTINGSDLHTVAVESEDLGSAIEVAAQLGIDELPNQSYQTAIRHVLRV
jgi:hypothetical protein